MECISVGEKIITVSIQTHGSIIDLDLSPEVQALFHKTRLFSFAGTYKSSFYSHDDARKYMAKMERAFSRDIEGRSMVQQLDEYILPLEEEYKSTLSKKKPRLSSQSQEDNDYEGVCKKIGAITIDKAFAKEEEGFLQKCVHTFLLPDLENIYVVSVHQKVSQNKYKLLSESPRNILQLSFFSEHGRPDIVEMIRRESTKLPDIEGAKNRIEKYKRNGETDKIDDLTRNTYREIQEWKCGLDAAGENITSIRLSFLTQILKMLYGNECIIQYIDYSCNELSQFVPESQAPYKVYHSVSDIEQGVVGGSKSKKKRGVKSRGTRRKTREICRKKRETRCKKRNAM